MALARAMEPHDAHWSRSSPYAVPGLGEVRIGLHPIPGTAPALDHRWPPSMDTLSAHVEQVPPHPRRLSCAGGPRVRLRGCDVT